MTESRSGRPGRVIATVVLAVTVAAGGAGLLWMPQSWIAAAPPLWGLVAPVIMLLALALSLLTVADIWSDRQLVLLRQHRGFVLRERCLGFVVNLRRPAAPLKFQIHKAVLHRTGAGSSGLVPSRSEHEHWLAAHCGDEIFVLARRPSEDGVWMWVEGQFRDSILPKLRITASVDVLIVS